MRGFVSVETQLLHSQPQKIKFKNGFNNKTTTSQTMDKFC